MIKMCSLYSGSSGNCVFLEANNTKILIDAGLSGIKTKKALESIHYHINAIDAIVISHEHSDHVKGAGILSRQHDIPLYANQLTWNAMLGSLGKLDTANIKTFKSNEKFILGDIQILPFSTPHDAADPVGFNFFYNNTKVTTITDIGDINEDLLAYIEGSQIVLLESNHDIELLRIGKYPWYLKQRILGNKGHLCNEKAGEIVAHLVKNGTSHILLGHLSKENNFPELVYQTVCEILKNKNIDPLKDVSLHIANRDRASEILTA